MGHDPIKNRYDSTHFLKYFETPGVYNILRGDQGAKSQQKPVPCVRTVCLALGPNRSTGSPILLQAPSLQVSTVARCCFWMSPMYPWALSTVPQKMGTYKYLFYIGVMSHVPFSRVLGGGSTSGPMFEPSVLLLQAGNLARSLRELAGRVFL